MTSASDAPDTPFKPSRRQLWFVVGPLIVLVAMSYTAEAIWPQIVESHPLWLIALSSRTRYLLATTNNLDAFSYYTVGTLRLLVSDPLFYLLGVWYGDRAVSWMERKSPSIGGQIRTMEQYFGVAAYPLVFLSPNNYICLFAGSSGMKAKWFIPLNVSGTIARLIAVRVLGDVFESPISGALDFVGRYRWQFLVGSVVLVLISIASDRIQGKSEIGSLRDLADDVEAPSDD